MKSDLTTETNERLQLIRHRLVLAIRAAEAQRSDLIALTTCHDEVCRVLAQRKVFA